VTAYRAQVAAALRAAAVRGPTRYAWVGRASRPLAAALEAEMDEPAREAYLVTSLARELYASFYCRGQPVPARWGEPAPLAPDPELTAALSEANVGDGSWQAGWTVARIENGQAVLMGDVRTRVPVGDCRGASGVQAGETVQVRVPKEHLWLSPGFYVALSDAAVDADPTHGILRAYWHITPTGAPRLMRALTSRLNADTVPFRLKIGDHPFRLDRCDGAVLYLSGASLDAVGPALSEIAADLRAHLRPSVPPFTLELAPGIGLAEHDGGPSSFGTVRCRLVAEAIVRARRQGLTVLGERIEAVASCFAAAGVDIDAPYREPALAGGHVL
jgi:class II lanthipeptide synthase